MKVNLGIWEILTWLVISLLLLAGVIGIAVWYMPLFQQNQRLRKEIFTLENQIEKENRISETLKSQLDAYQNDPRAVERLARERLGYAKPGETVILFKPSETHPPQTAPNP